MDAYREVVFITPDFITCCKVDITNSIMTKQNLPSLALSSKRALLYMTI